MKPATLRAPGLARLGWTESDGTAIGAHRAGDWYTSPAVLAAEREHVFAHAWALVASEEQLPPGHYLATTIGTSPIVVWRDSDGTWRAWHNLCRHRGITLLEGTGPIGRFVTCPYHQWSYASDGSLARVPQPEQFPDMDPGEWGLLAVPLTVWHGMVFACPDPDPVPFELAVGGLAGRLANYLDGPLVEVARAEYTVGCNWKFLIENHVDVYHLWYLHARSLGGYEHRSFRWEWMDGNWWSQEPLKDPAAAGPGLPGLAEHERSGIGAHLLFPNLMIVTTGDYLATYDSRPLGTDRSALTLRVRSVAGADGDSLVASIRAFLAEDVVACEALQAAAGSPQFGLGPLAERHEAPIREFHARLRRALLGAVSPVSERIRS